MRSPSTPGFDLRDAVDSLRETFGPKTTTRGGSGRQRDRVAWRRATTKDGGSRVIRTRDRVKERKAGARSRTAGRTPEMAMPRYFFHIEDGAFTRDSVGVELPDDAAARIEGVRRTGECLALRPQKFWESRRWRILIAPEVGSALLGLEVTPVDGPYLIPWQHG